MAEAAVGALGASATLVASKVGYSLAFTARHENNYRAEVLDTERISDAIMKARKSGDVSERDFIALLEQRSISIEHTTRYYRSIEEYKDVSALHVTEKLAKRDCVRKNKDPSQRWARA
ncbi:hypothetical protein CYLTODRAFT_451667 [Cylindrobasidium torrendii FP15055 ss-10]|uniref:Uncharacterized protein n=1 Tax=Cylindrobasidium torrendii FP15055 ss-10 TaxID=1314674 RepID=A0A0D7BIW4_9AGAR|nr:hypothetical protein CYLTODRAFT_451667 [Cylindrobasidium torrendii FP15055 ss-10]